MAIRRIYAAGGAEGAEQKDSFLSFVASQITVRGRKPRLCLLAQASGENTDRAVQWKKMFEKAGFEYLTLTTFWEGPSFKEVIEQADAFFVPGGNTRNLLLLWHGRGIDTLLRSAYDAGKPMAGYSAGAACWFEAGWVSVEPGVAGYLPALGWLQGSLMPHFSQAPEKATAYEKCVAGGCISPGYGIDDGAIAYFENEQLRRFYNFAPEARAYHITTHGRHELPMEQV